MSPRREDRYGLRRRIGTRWQRDRILVVCEGRVTEVEYLNGLRDHFKALPVEIVDCKVVGAGCGPARVVERAVAERDRKAGEARRRRDPYRAYDGVWGVVDVNDHVDLQHAVRLAERERIGLLVSNPCFELWLLHHYQDYAVDGTREQLGRKLLRHLPGYDKHIPADFAFHAHPEAERRALRVDAELTVANRIGGNPSTNVWLVVNAMRASGDVR